MDGNKTRTSQPSSGMGNETTSNQPIVLGAGGESTRLVSGNENNFQFNKNILKKPTAALENLFYFPDTLSLKNTGQI